MPRAPPSADAGRAHAVIAGVFPFRLRFTGAKVEGTPGRIAFPPFIGGLGTAVHMPSEGDAEYGDRHWNIIWILSGAVLKRWLVDLAKAHKTPGL